MLRALIPTGSAVTRRHTERSVLANTHPQHLFRIISDVDKYVDFLPLCRKSTVLQRSECGTMFDAELTVGWPSLFEERYVSRVRTSASDDGSQFAVEAKSIRSNAFDSLRSRWKLSHVGEAKSGTDADGEKASSSEKEYSESSVPEGQSKFSGILKAKNSQLGKMEQTPPVCAVEFEVEMSVSNPIIASTLDQVLRDVAKKQMAAFRQRCQDIPFNDTTKR